MSFMWPTAPPDFVAAMKAAEALGVSEYDFFRLAFRRWLDREANEKTLERSFVAYMFHQNVPVWVRHFSRDVLSRDAAGILDAAELGALKYRHHPPPHRNGPLYIGLMGAMMVPSAWKLGLSSVGSNTKWWRPGTKRLKDLLPL